jgi:hypothetical protein
MKPNSYIFKKIYFGKTTILLTISLLLIFNLFGQTDSIKPIRNNVIKLNLITLPPLFNNLNQKWLGIEYQRILNDKFSLSITTDIGKFEDYSFTKYHDFFDEYGGFSYTKERVKIKGFHLIPSFNWNLTNSENSLIKGIYTSVKFDYYQYFSSKEIYESSIEQSEIFNNSTLRFNIGCGIGAQYLFFNRMFVDLNISIFTKIASSSSSSELPEINPKNSFWISNNNSTWTTINLMLGYTFGSSTKTRKK